MIDVVIVEDSPVSMEVLVHVLSSDPNLRVVGQATSGEEGIELVKKHRPSIVTMDIQLPKMDGLQATRIIMETCPTPIVIVTSNHDPHSVEVIFKSLEAGALSVIEKPRAVGHPESARLAKELIQTVKLMSEVKVVGRRHRQLRSSAENNVKNKFVDRQSDGLEKIVVVGASTGGPPAIEAILRDLPREIPAPILIVQHISTGFVQGFCEWLSQITSLPVHIATDDEQLLCGHVYIAPDGYHLGVKKKGRSSLSKGEGGLQCPSVEHLFRSVAEVYGPDAIGVLLSGMGRDGADGLKTIHDLGAFTIAQDQDSSVVFGMPWEAIRKGAATYVLPPKKISEMLVSILMSPTGGSNGK